MHYNKKIISIGFLALSLSAILANAQNSNQLSFHCKRSALFDKKETRTKFYVEVTENSLGTAIIEVPDEIERNQIGDNCASIASKIIAIPGTKNESTGPLYCQKTGSWGYSKLGQPKYTEHFSVVLNGNTGGPLTENGSIYYPNANECLSGLFRHFVKIVATSGEKYKRFKIEKSAELKKEVYKLYTIEDFRKKIEQETTHEQLEHDSHASIQKSESLPNPIHDESESHSGGVSQ